MYKIVYTNRMKKDAKLMKKRGKNMEKLIHVLSLLANGTPLPAQFKDHPRLVIFKILENATLNRIGCYYTKFMKIFLSFQLQRLVLMQIYSENRKDKNNL